MRKLLIISTAMLMMPGTAFGAGYMKLGDIKGEATDSAHKDWIIIESMSTGLSQPGGSATGQSRRRGSVVVEDMIVSRKVSAASPILAQAAASGKVFPKVEMEVKSGNVLYNVTLENATISTYQVSGDADEVPTEEVSFNYKKITWTYSGPSGKSSQGWDFATGR
ncbi:MAG: type VI secretion system tube protein Hcp [Hellea sp.]|nr:type VI secretion system tube protein Hcp [Hellea sp.]